MDERRVDRLKEVCIAIKEVSDQDSVEQVVSNYFDVEEKNFRLFSYVTKVNDEVNRLTDQASTIEEDVAKMEEEEKAVTDRQDKDLAELEVLHLNRYWPCILIHTTKLKKNTYSLNVWSIKQLPNLGCLVNNSNAYIGYNFIAAFNCEM